MIVLTQEVIFLHGELTKVGVETKSIDVEINQIKEKYEKIFNLKDNYINLSELQKFNEYESNAKDSVLKQLKEPYEFNYTELSKMYISHDGDWSYQLSCLLKEKEELKKNDSLSGFKMKEAEDLKVNFIKQFKSFNNLLKNGIINYVHSFAADLSRESYEIINKSKISAEDYFNREIRYHNKGLERFSKDEYHLKEIKKLEERKEEYIQIKIEDKAFFEKYLTILHRQEKNIFQVLDKVKVNLLNTEAKDTITFEGDINNGFVIGKFSNSDKVLLVHKDTFVDVKEAVYAMILSGAKYKELIDGDKLLFNKELRNEEFSNASNFWSYGQFLQEISSSNVQNFFLGKEFDLVDKTVVSEMKKEKNLKNKF